jgi:phasin family protein
MSSTDHNKPAAKGARGNRKPPRTPKPKQARTPQVDELEAAAGEPIVPTAEPEPIEAAAEPVAIEAAATEESAPIEAAAPTAAPVDADAPEQTTPADTRASEDTGLVGADALEETAPVDTRASEDTAPIGARAAPAAAPVSLQTIANAYGDYTRRSLEETRSFVEKLKGAKSLDKAVEVQTEYAHHAFEMFVAESRKIYGLHRELARQTLKPLEGLMKQPNRDRR